MDPFSLGIAVAGAGLDFFGKKMSADSQLRQRNRAIKIQNRQAREATRLQNQQIRDRNRYSMYEYEMRKRLGQQQIAANADAANQAYMAENLRLQDQLTQAAFQRSGMQRQLLEAAGANAAMNEGNRGRSFERAAAIGTYGDYGRTMAQMNEGLTSMRGQSAANIRRLAQQHRQADMNVRAQTAIMPYMQRELPPALQMPLQKSSGFNTALQIGQAMLGGAQTYMSLAAPGAGDIGGGGGGSLGGKYDTNPVAGMGSFDGNVFKNPANFDFGGGFGTGGSMAGPTFGQGGSLRFPKFP